MARRAIKKVVLINKQLFGLDIWPLGVQKNKTSFCRILSLGLGWAARRSNAFGVAPSENFGNSAHVLLSRIDSKQRKLKNCLVFPSSFYRLNEILSNCYFVWKSAKRELNLITASK